MPRPVYSPPTFRAPCIVGNWKMHGCHQKNIEWVKAMQSLLQERSQFEISALAALEIVLCPPAPYIEQLKALIQQASLKISLALGLQDVHHQREGAYTGEISPTMLVDLGCQYVIIGHSERRQYLGETDELIARKFVAAYDVGLTPILCVGETLAERQSGKTMERVESQIRAVLERASPDVFQRAWIAYEPVWAIGTGISATPSEAQIVQAGIRALLRKVAPATAEQMRILYGGSVKGDNAAALFSQPDIDGGLIGGASLNPREFLLICQAAIVE